MNERINVRKRWRGIDRRSWILAATVVVSLSANACGKNYEPAGIPESIQAPGDDGNDGVTGTGNAGAGTGGDDVAADSDTASAGVTGGEGVTGMAGNAAANGDVSMESSALEITIVMETAPSSTDVSETVYVTGDQVNLRADASISVEVVTALSKGTSLRRTAVSDIRSRVAHQEKTCYISTQYVSTVQSETESAKAASTANDEEVKLNPSWKYADFSKTNPGTAILYKSEAASQRDITICANASHGTKGGSSVKTQCHPDGTPKATGGTTSAGVISAVTVFGGMQFFDGATEAKVTLAMAKKLKDKLLAERHDILMIRETDDVQLDNTARTVIANSIADCHIVLHWDSIANNKGAFYMNVPNMESYRNMEPVRPNWQKHCVSGDNPIVGLKSMSIKIFFSGATEMDLTQTSSSTVPFIDIELGDKVLDRPDATLDTLADGLVAEVKNYLGK